MVGRSYSYDDEVSEAWMLNCLLYGRHLNILNENFAIAMG